jgi:hypothetical protein
VSRSPVRTVAGVTGATFLLVGTLGFAPGVTENLAGMTMAGHRSSARLLGIFEVSVLHNAVHILFGFGGLLAARTAAASRAFLVTGGFVYLLLTVYGAVIEPDSPLNLVPFNYADNALHLLLGTVMLGLGVGLPDSPGRHQAAQRQQPATKTVHYRF